MFHFYLGLFDLKFLIGEKTLDCSIYKKKCPAWSGKVQTNDNIHATLHTKVPQILFVMIPSTVRIIWKEGPSHSVLQQCSRGHSNTQFYSYIQKHTDTRKKWKCSFPKLPTEGFKRKCLVITWHKGEGGMFYLA